MKLKLYFTLGDSAIYSRIFDAEEDMLDLRTWVEDQGGDTRVLVMDRDRIMEVCGKEVK